MQRYWWLTPLLRMMLPPNRIQVKLRQGENTFGAFIQFHKGSIFGTRRGGGTGTTYRLGYHVLSLVTILVGYNHTISEN